MHYFCRMQIFESAKHLISEEGNLRLFQLLNSEKIIQIAFHSICDNISNLNQKKVKLSNSATRWSFSQHFTLTHVRSQLKTDLQ